LFGIEWAMFDLIRDVINYFASDFYMEKYVIKCIR